MLARLRAALAGVFRRSVSPAAKPTKARRTTPNAGNGGRKAMAVERQCPFCPKVTRGAAHFRHVKLCSENPANKAAQPPAEQPPILAAIAGAADPGQELSAPKAGPDSAAPL